MLENNLRKALILSQGDFTPFVMRPISAVCLIAAALLLLSPLLPSFQKRRRELATDEG
jgi:putative tricarboxylic transport membrane protein